MLGLPLEQHPGGAKREVRTDRTNSRHHFLQQILGTWQVPGVFSVHHPLTNRRPVAHLIAETGPHGSVRLQ